MEQEKDDGAGACAGGDGQTAVDELVQEIARLCRAGIGQGTDGLLGFLTVENRLKKRDIKVVPGKAFSHMAHALSF